MQRHWRLPACLDGRTDVVVVDLLVLRNRIHAELIRKDDEDPFIQRTRERGQGLRCSGGDCEELVLAAWCHCLKQNNHCYCMIAIKLQYTVVLCPRRCIVIGFWILPAARKMIYVVRRLCSSKVGLTNPRERRRGARNQSVPMQTRGDFTTESESCWHDKIHSSQDWARSRTEKRLCEPRHAARLFGLLFERPRCCIQLLGLLVCKSIRRDYCIIQ